MKFNMTETTFGFTWSLEVDGELAGSGAVVLGECPQFSYEVPVSAACGWELIGETREAFAARITLVDPDDGRQGTAWAEREAYITGTYSSAYTTPREIVEMVKERWYENASDDEK